MGALFLFPNTVDARIVRTTGAVVSLASLTIALLGLFDSTHDAAEWMSVGLLVDFVLRFIAGANASVLGAFAAVPPLTPVCPVFSFTRNVENCTEYPRV